MTGINVSCSKSTFIDTTLMVARRRGGKASFTLVEVVISIAVIAIALVSILGLMTYTSRLVRESDNYSRLSSVVSQVISRYDSQPFSVSTNCARTNAIYYFSYEGLPTNSAAAYYQCDVTNANSSTWALSNVMQIQLNVRWPKPQFVNTNVLVISTLNYD